MREFYAVVLKVTPLCTAMEAALAVPVLLTGVVAPLVLREQPQPCLSHIAVSAGWGRAVLCFSVP